MIKRITSKRDKSYQKCITKCVVQRTTALITFPETIGLHPLKVGHGMQQIT